MAVLNGTEEGRVFKNITQFSLFCCTVNEDFQLVAMLLVDQSQHTIHFLHHINNFEETGVQTEQERTREEKTRINR